MTRGRDIHQACRDMLVHGRGRATHVAICLDAGGLGEIAAEPSEEHGSAPRGLPQDRAKLVQDLAGLLQRARGELSGLLVTTHPEAKHAEILYHSAVPSGTASASMPGPAPMLSPPASLADDAPAGSARSPSCADNVQADAWLPRAS